ncbi:MAG: S41 family peptidase [Saprospiraceae bacterium]
MINQTENSSNKLNIWLPLIFSVVLAGGMFIGMKLQKSSPVVQIKQDGSKIVGTRGEAGRVEEVIRYIESQYVEDVDREKLIENAIEEVLSDLDPHSSYIPAKELIDVNEQMEGNFEGVGIEFLFLEDTIMVVTPMSGGPSEQVGILPGDKIVQIEDTIVAGVKMDREKIIDKLRGEKGTTVKVGIKRLDEATLKDFTITRDRIPINSVDVGYMLDPETGYIKVSRFSATTYKEFMKYLEELVEKQDMKHLVIDLRQNPGGYLQQATNILNQLFDQKDKLLVYTEGSSVRRNEYETTGKNFYQIGNVALLIDEGSASASEILAGAVQDWDRGVVIGRRSYGKGLVQEQYDLKDGSALRLTVARYYTPSKRLIQKSYSDIDNYGNDVYDRFESGELYTKDSIHVLDTTKFYTAQGRVVYGGGGITPDLFIPLDSIVMNDYYLKVRQHLLKFSYRYFEKHKTKLEAYSLEDFSKSYNIAAAGMDDLLSYAVENGVERDEAKFDTCRAALAQLLKTRLAKQLFGDKGYYKVKNDKDPVVDAARRVVQEKNPLSQLKKY